MREVEFQFPTDQALDGSSSLQDELFLSVLTSRYGANPPRLTADAIPSMKNVGQKESQEKNKTADGQKATEAQSPQAADAAEKPNLPIDPSKSILNRNKHDAPSSSSNLKNTRGDNSSKGSGTKTLDELFNPPESNTQEKARRKLETQLDEFETNINRDKIKLNEQKRLNPKGDYDAQYKDIAARERQLRIQRLDAFELGQKRDKEILKNLKSQYPQLDLYSLERTIKNGDRMIEEHRADIKRADEARERETKNLIQAIEFGINHFDELKAQQPGRLSDPTLLSHLAVFCDRKNAPPDNAQSKHMTLEDVIRKIGRDVPNDSGFPLYRSSGDVKAVSKQDLKNYLEKQKS